MSKLYHHRFPVQGSAPACAVPCFGTSAALC
jgi:hypothetical protein